MKGVLRINETPGTFSPRAELDPDRLLTSTEALHLLGGQRMNELDWYRLHRQLKGVDVGGVTKYRREDVLRSMEPITKRDLRDIRLMVAGGVGSLLLMVGAIVKYLR